MKRIILSIFAMILVLSYVYFNFITTFNLNVLDLDYHSNKQIQLFFPQGWGFFTRNPREEKYRLYRIEQDGFSLVNYKITSKENYFGLSRKGNRVSMEMERVRAKLPDKDQWTKAKGEPEDLLQGKIAFHDKVAKPDEVLYIDHGQYVMIAYDITPWAWLRHDQSYTKDFKYFSFELE